MKRLLVTLALLGLSLVAEAQSAPVTITLTPSVTSGVVPYSTTLTWSATNTVGTTPCTASGLWTGTKAASGSQVVTVSAPGSFTLTCTGATDTATLSWVNPTQNTDGSALTNMAGVKVFWSQTSTGLGSAAPNGQLGSPTVTSYTITGLAVGTWYFGVKAYTTTGVDSAISMIVSKVISIASASASVPVTVTTVPNPPSGVAVTVTAAYNLRNGKPYMVVGNVDLGTPCGPFVARKWGVDFYTVPNDKVSPPQPQGQVTVAQCG